MSHKEMQDAWIKSGIRSTPVNYTVFKAAWYAAHAVGYAAGMERAAAKIDIANVDSGYGFAAFIRAEIKEKG